MAVATHPSVGDPGDVVDYYPLRPFMPIPSDLPPKIRVRVPPADISSIFAHRQWKAGMLLADLIYSGYLPIKGSTVLELGAGTGLPSIAAYTYGKARKVVSTDYDFPSLIANLSYNVKSNTAASSQSSIKVAGHVWAKAIDEVQELVADEGYDVILLADCIWDSLSHADLLKSVTSLLRKNPRSRIYLISGLHTGRSKIVSFLRRAHRLNLCLVEFPSGSNNQWPTLSPSECKVQKQEAELHISDVALANASQKILEMQILSDKSEEEACSNKELDGTIRVWHAKSARLSDIRRSFVVEDRKEETNEGNSSIHIRNRWVTFSALAWQ